MLTGDYFKQVVYGYWARRFECNREDFARPGTLVIKEKELAETRKTHIYQIDRMSIVRTFPILAKQAGLPDGCDRDFASLSVNRLQELAADKFKVEVESTLLDFFLDPEDFVPFPVGKDFTTHRLYAESENSILLSLFEACTEEDLDNADINIEEPDPVIYGIFSGKKLVAYASFRYWDDVIADMGVLIHPDYRGQGLGKAVISVLCKWCIENDVVPMYRVFNDHPYSIRIPQALGFQDLVIIETLKIMGKVG